MARFFFHDTPSQLRKGSRFLLAFFWVAGLLCGMLAFRTGNRQFLLLMRSVIYEPVSIVGVLFSVTFPFLISASAVFMSKPGFLFPICFAKAFSFSVVSIGILQAYGSAGWLIRFFLLFGDYGSLPLLYWYWMRNIPRAQGASHLEAGAILSLLVLIGSINFRVIAPFLASLIEYTKG